ncbi:MAG: two-component system, LytT family, response regulator AlgR [Pseudomonadota bacterium]
MKILVVDDEALARERLIALLAELGPGYELAGSAGNGAEALAACAAGAVDLVLLDIRMPGMDGLAAARELAQMPAPPAVIFTTAYEEHALAAFDANAVDYLLKPIRRSRLEAALQRARRPTRAQLEALDIGTGEPGPAIAATYRGGLQRIPLADVIYLRADSKYVVVRHAQGEALVEDSLASFEERFPGRFRRVHRSALVTPAAVQGLAKTPDGRTVLTFRGLDDQVEVSRRHLPAVRAWLRGE